MGNTSIKKKSEFFDPEDLIASLKEDVKSIDQSISLQDQSLQDLMLDHSENSQSHESNEENSLNTELELESGQGSESGLDLDLSFNDFSEQESLPLKSELILQNDPLLQDNPLLDQESILQNEPELHLDRTQSDNGKEQESLHLSTDEVLTFEFEKPSQLNSDQFQNHSQSFDQKQEQDYGHGQYNEHDSLTQVRTLSETEGFVGVKSEQNFKTNHFDNNLSNDEKTVVVQSFSHREKEDRNKNIKISLGHNYKDQVIVPDRLEGLDHNLVQSENLKIAQEKILEIESENEKLRLQNSELIAASEIIQEKYDLIHFQLKEQISQKSTVEEYFKAEIQILKNELNLKDHSLEKSQQKIEEYESRLKFDLKKIRIRERELENRLELLRAEKNALVKSKDEQILDLRRKLDQMQLEVDSFRQKCIELNKVIDTNQESFKRTTRALKLAMANLELSEEFKQNIKKVE